MQSPITLTFRNVERSGAVEDRARTLASRLERFSQGIMKCHMTIEGPASPQGRQSAYQVKIDLTLPRAHIHADSLQVDGEGHRDIYVALREAFINAKRQLEGLNHDRSSLHLTRQMDSR
jgi:hypothetical protein